MWSIRRYARRFAKTEGLDISVARSSKQNGLADVTIDGITVFLIAEQVSKYQEAAVFLSALREAVSQQPNSEDQNIVLEHLSETKYLIQAFTDTSSADLKNEWEFELLLPFSEGVGFFAESRSETLAFYEFSHDDFMNFKYPRFFSNDDMRDAL